MRAYHTYLRSSTGHEEKLQQSESMRLRMRRHILFVIILFVMVCIAYPGWFGNGSPAYDDLTRLNGPQRVYLGWALRHGHLPLWNPFSFGGQPFLAAGQSGPLYLPNLIYMIMPIAAALKVSYAFHAMLAAFGCYLAAYHLTRLRWAAVASGMVFVTSGFMIGHQIHTQMYDAISWLPLLFYLSLRMLDDPSRRLVVLAGICGALEIYAGHPQITFDELFFLGVFVVVCIAIRHSHRALFAGLHLILSGILAALLSALQWLPTLQLVTYSDRQQLPAWFLLQLSMPPEGWFQFLTPFTAGGGYTGTPFDAVQYTVLYGTPLFWELSCYAGITALVLAVTGASTRFRRHPAVPAIVVTAILSVLLAVGADGPLRDVLVDVPGFDLFRVPARFTGLLDLCIAILCAVGIAAVYEAVRKSRTTTLWVLSATSGLSIAAVLAMNAVLPLPSARFVITAIPVCLAVLTSSTAWLTWFCRRHSQSRPQSGLPGLLSPVVLLSVLVLADVTSQSAFKTPFIMQPSPAYVSVDAATTFIKQHLTKATPLAKIVSLPDAPLAFDESASFQIPSLDGYDSLEPSWYAANVNLTWAADQMFQSPRSMLDAYGVKYMVTTPTDSLKWATTNTGPSSWQHTFTNIPSGVTGLELGLAGLGPVSVTPGPLLSVTLVSGRQQWTELLTGTTTNRFLIPLPDGWPRGEPTTIFVRCETWTASFYLQTLQWVTPDRASEPPMKVHQALHPEPWQAVYVNPDATIWENPDATDGAWVSDTRANPIATQHGSVKSLSDAPNRQVWQVKSAQSGYLVLGQTYDPNWHAYVDGVPAPAMQAGALYGSVLTGVPVPKGAHQVVLVYQPAPFYAGLYITASTVVLLLILQLLRRGVRRRRRV